MNNEQLNQKNDQNNETYDAWQNMADKVRRHDAEKVETDDGYASEDWVAFEANIKNPEESAAFKENIGHLDKRTRDFLRNLPANIDQIFGVNKESYEMLNKVQSTIIRKGVAGSYNLGEHDGKDFSLYLTNDGKLYAGSQAANARENDASNTSETEKSFDDVWGGWLHGIKDQKDRERFSENMKKLDKRTQKYLSELPGNIDCVFGVNEESYALLGEVERKIIDMTISGRYTPEGYKGENWNLYLANDGKLVCDYQAGEYRKKDGASNNAVAVSEQQEADKPNTENHQETEHPEDFGFRDW